MTSHCVAVLVLLCVVEAMFTALSQCQLLHPDPEEESEDEEEERGEIIDSVLFVKINPCRLSQGTNNNVCVHMYSAYAGTTLLLWRCVKLLEVKLFETMV